MTCNDAEMAIIQGDAEISEEVASHLAQCAKCRAFADLQRKLMANPPAMTPPAMVDRRVLREARQRLGHRPGSWRPAWPALVLAAAAALALAAVLTGLMWPRSATSPTVAQSPTESDIIELSPWTAAVLDLEALDTEVDAALTELSTNTATRDNGTTRNWESESSWDDLMQLEIEMYFESEQLEVDG